MIARRLPTAAGVLPMPASIGPTFIFAKFTLAKFTPEAVIIAYMTMRMRNRGIITCYFATVSGYLREN